MEKEIWVDIIGSNGEYKVSNKGRFISFKNKNKKLLKTGTNGMYKIIRFNTSKGIETHRVHRLLAQYFIPNPDNLPIVEHKDDNCLNNNLDNLMWSTIVNNSINRHHRGAKDIAKIILQYDLIGNLIDKFPSVREAAKSVGADSHGGLNRVLLKTGKPYRNFIWKYAE